MLSLNAFHDELSKCTDAAFFVALGKCLDLSFDGGVCSGDGLGDGLGMRDTLTTSRSR